MRRSTRLALLVALLAGCGCGRSTTLNTAPLTDEQKREIKENDRKTDEEENGPNTKRQKKQ